MQAMAGRRRGGEEEQQRAGDAFSKALVLDTGGSRTEQLNPSSPGGHIILFAGNAGKQAYIPEILTNRRERARRPVH